MIKTNWMERAAMLGAIIATGVSAVARPLAAQSVTPDGRWQGWLGCWQPVSPTTGDSYSDWMDTRARDAGLPTLCIVPSSTPTAVDFVTVAAGTVTARETIDASQERIARKRDNCDGFEGASWSADGRRIYTRSEYSCDGGVKRTSSGMLAMSGLGQLIDIQEIASGGVKSVHVSRYTSVRAPAGLGVDSTLVPASEAIAVSAARTAIAGPLTGADIVDAVNNADSLVVEAWLVERGQRFNIDAKHLVALADAGVPARITDLMIALSYPNVFAFDRAVAMRAPTAGSRVYVTVPRSDPFGYMSGYGGYPYGYGPLGYDPAFYGYAYNRGYGGYGYGGYGYGYLYQPPVVIVRGGPGGTGRTHGRVVNGQGYTRDRTDGSSTGATAMPRNPNSGGSSTGSTASGSSSGSSTSSSGSEGSTRHAKPRP